MWHSRVTFYEAVTTTVKLDPQTCDDEWLVGADWVSMNGPAQMTLLYSLPTLLAAEAVVAQVDALPEGLYLFVAYFLDHEGIRVGFYRTSSEKVLEWGDTDCPPWFRPAPVEGPSRYELLMEDG